MPHYYTNNIDLKSEESLIHFRYRNHDLYFVSDHGVFSKERVDFGSRVLLDVMDIREDQKTLLCVLTTREYYFLRSMALEIDPSAFVFVEKASEVHGEGFTYEKNSR